MHIAINATYRLHGGGLTHLTHLLEAWSRTGVAHEHVVSLFTRAENVAALRGLLKDGIELRAIGNRPMSLAAKLAWEQAVFPHLLARTEPDVLLCPGSIAPLRSLVPTVVAFRNAGPFCASVTWRSTGVHDWLWLKMLGVLMKRAARSARRVIFISEYFKDLFVRRFRFPAERGDVIYHGRDALRVEPPERSLLQRLGIRPPYVLSIAHLYPYKNLPALIEGYAFARQTLQAKGLRLVIAGTARHEWYGHRLKALIHHHDLDDWVILTGAVPHAAIGPLLAGCEFFVFQSTCENCPTTLIEALAAGVPIACANIGVMPEIAGDAAVYFDPFEAIDIARALCRLVEEASLRDDLRQQARRQALKFPTWDEVGQLTLHSLQRAVGER